MKSIVTDITQPEGELRFPCLKIDPNDGEILLFISDYQAVVVKASSDQAKWPLGTLQPRAPHLYDCFHGSVTLSN